MALLGLLLASWLILLLMPILALTQERIFFRQMRTGKDGKPFRLIKFSTLRDIRPGEREEDDQIARLTPVGRFLRKLSLDEIPQLWNVLKGEMSIVGPRPLIHAYWPIYKDWQKRRFEVRPGITGWAQINGRNALSFNERFQLDIWYIDHHSCWLDCKIMLKTPIRALAGKGVFVSEATTQELFDGEN